jgi:hypothetical protein
MRPIAVRQIFLRLILNPPQYYPTHFVCRGQHANKEMGEAFAKPGIKEFDTFLRNEFSKRIRESYEKLEILSEADLQAHAWLRIRQFFNEFKESGHRFRVLNKPYFREAGIHPDLGVFKRRKSWVLIELKERKKVSERHARKERDRLLANHRILEHKE